MRCLSSPTSGSTASDAYSPHCLGDRASIPGAEGAAHRCGGVRPQQPKYKFFHDQRRQGTSLDGIVDDIKRTATKG
jgi:hypothetical protein